MALYEIIAGCLKENQRDFKRLYKDYYGYSLKVVFRYIYRYDKAVDVVNDGFVKVLGKLDMFHCDPSQNIDMLFKGWLRRIMINTAIDRLRKDNFIPEIGLTEEFWVEDKSRSADQTLLYKDLIIQVKKLPPAYRIVFNMYVIDGYTHQEIANHLHVEVGTSKSNLSKAKAILRDYIRKNEEQLQICNM